MTGETITRLRAPVVEDRYGAESRDWEAATSTDIDECVVAPRPQGEAHDDGRQGVIVGYTIYAPAGTDIVPSDRLTIRGNPHEVDGQPSAWVNPWTQVTEGVEIQARRVDG